MKFYRRDLYNMGDTLFISCHYIRSQCVGNAFHFFWSFRMKLEQEALMFSVRAIGARGNSMHLPRLLCASRERV